MQLAPGTSPLIPIATNNVALASALHIGGVPWFKDELGRAVGILNDYTPAKLAAIDAERTQRKQRPLNLSLLLHEEAVKTAFRAGIPGDVTYQFERTEQALQIVAGFEAQGKYIAATDAGINASAVPVQVTSFVIGVIVCQAFRERKSFQGEPPSHGSKGIKPYWMHAPPFAIEDGLQRSSRPVRGGTETTIEGSHRRTEVHP